MAKELEGLEGKLLDQSGVGGGFMTDEDEDEENRIAPGL